MGQGRRRRAAPVKIKPEMVATFAAMLEELESSRLVVCVAPAPDPRHTGHGVRCVFEKNAAWYRAFCAAFPSSRRDQNSKGRTAIKRRETSANLLRLVSGIRAGPVYGPRLFDAARAYWKKNQKEIRERMRAESHPF